LHQYPTNSTLGLVWIPLFSNSFFYFLFSLNSCLGGNGPAPILYFPIQPNWVTRIQDLQPELLIEFWQTRLLSAPDPFDWLLNHFYFYLFFCQSGSFNLEKNNIYTIFTQHTHIRWDLYEWDPSYRFHFMWVCCIKIV